VCWLVVVVVVVVVVELCVCVLGWVVGAWSGPDD